MRDTMIFYRSFYEAIKELPPENKIEVYDAIFSYSLDFSEPDLSGISKTIFTLIKPRFIRGFPTENKKHKQLIFIGYFNKKIRLSFCLKNKRIE